MFTKCVDVGTWLPFSDWEFAASGAPLTDIGHFLRYERDSFPRLEPHFSKGYIAGGGNLAEGWRRKARILDLAAFCESLTHDDLLASATQELIELVLATVQDRDSYVP